MNRKIAYLIGFLISAGYISLVTLAPKWVGGLASSLLFIGAFTYVIGSALESRRTLPKIKGENDA